MQRREVIGGLAALGLTASAPVPRDDTAQLQAMIDDPNAGAVVRLPPGVWHFRELNFAMSGRRIMGAGPRTVLRHIDPTRHAFRFAAPDLSLTDLRLEGTARSPRHSRFAIFTEPDRPAPRAVVERVTFSGADASAGFTNAIKFDAHSNDPLVRDCRFERLWGSDSGFGYGILCGAMTGGVFEGNRAAAGLGRGRHFVYLSSGASRCIVRNNQAEGFDYEALTAYATDAQPTCRGNLIHGNALIASCRRGRIDVAAISLFRNVQDSLVEDNRISRSGGTGILFNGTSTRNFRNNRAVNNLVVDSAFIGIDLIALQGGSLEGNVIRESSRAEPGVHPNIRLASDGRTATSRILIVGNRSSGRQFARSAFQINATRPLPHGLSFRANMFEPGSLAGVELAGLPLSVE